MSKLVVSGAPPYDGEYELSEDRVFNGREWRWIKKISGYLPATIQEGWDGRDPDLFIALAAIAMCRDGKIDRDDGFRVADVLSEPPFDGLITLIADEVEEDDAGPPDVTGEPDGSSLKSSLEKQTFSGPPLKNGSDQSEPTQSPTTPTRSDTSPTSGQTELVS